METTNEQLVHNSKPCLDSSMAVKDALDVLNGKWKLSLIVALQNGPMRFKDIQRSLDGITPKILSKELKELELNEFVERKVVSTRPVTILYELTPYSGSLKKVVDELVAWGLQYRQRIKAGIKNASYNRKAIT